MIHYILPVIGAFVMSTICGFIFIPVLLNFCKEKKNIRYTQPKKGT